MISFVIPSYNSFLTVERTIRSILDQSRADKILEIIVVDSSDDEKTRQTLKTINSPKFRWIECAEKTSPSRARNLGAAQAQGELLSFIDSDVYLSPDWVNEVAAAYHEGIQAGSGSVTIPPFQIFNRLALAQWYLQFNEMLETGRSRKIQIAPACNFFVAKKAFEAAGGFPDLRASEDTLFCLALGKSVDIYFVPQARCYHIFRQERAAYFNNQKMLGRYILIYRKIHYGSWWYEGWIPLVLLPIFLIIKALRIQGRIWRAGQDHGLRFLNCFPQFCVGFFWWAVGFAGAAFLPKEPARTPA